jgi:hypothetical protein
MRQIQYRTWCIAAAIACAAASVGAAQAGVSLAAPAPRVATRTPAAKPESVTVVAGARYQAGALHRWFVGDTYRDLWTMPIRVPVLNRLTYFGGLHPTKEGGGMQTKSLRFETADGVEYVFRLSDKGETGTPKQLKNTVVDRFFQDAVSAMHPAAAEIAAPILAATGVMHPTAVLVVMPADSSLGKFSADFAGRLGMIEEYPSVPKTVLGFGGATKIIDSDELLHLMNKDAKEHVDARAFLAARLTDFLINDNDRHSGQWKWARLESGPKTQWQPIARDRDHALIQYDGVLLRLAAMAQATLVSFDNAPNVPGLTWPREFDARLLSGLEKAVWDSVAVAIQGRVTDAVIDSAVREMPVEYSASASRLSTVLLGRRDALPKAATQYYRMLAAHVQVHGTDSSDRATITRVSDGVVDVRLESEGKPFFSRRFDARETSEIVVDLHGGDDTAVVTGNVQRSITLRIIGGNGTNTLMDSSTVGAEHNVAHIYDQGTVDGVSYGPDTMFDRRPWERTNGVLAPPGADAGARYAPIVGISDRRGVGITPRIGLAKYTYGFRRRPYESMVRLEGEYATQFRGGRVSVVADRRLESSPVYFTATARVSDFQVVNYNGFGNATTDSGSSNPYFAVHQRQWLFHPAVALAIGSTTNISLGPVIQHSISDDARSPYLAASRPYGVGSFTQVAVQFGVRYEWRAASDSDEHTHHRVLIDLNELYFPAAMDVRSAFQETAVSIGTSVTIPLPTQPLFIIRTGGTKLFGDFPFYEGASIGGEGTTRYMDPQRYLGDASLYATTELRVPLAQFKLVVPLRMGLMGIAEAGRVYVGGNSPGGWHSRTGEGVWFGQGSASPIVTIMRTTEPGHTGIGLGLGLNF